MNDVPLLMQIVDHVEQRPGATARSISAALQVDRSAVNRLLYREQTLFVCLGGQPPQWAVDVEAAATSEATTATKGDGDNGGTLALYEWQREALEKWQGNDRNGIVEAVTGAGKTRLALAAVREALGAGERVAVLVPTIELLRQWEVEIEEHFPGVSIGVLGAGSHDSLEEVQLLIATRNSASKYPLGLPAHCAGLLIADECHRFGSETMRLGLKEGFAARLGLSATYERADGAHLSVLEPYFGGVVYQLGYGRAVADGVVAPVRVACLGVEFTSGERVEWDRLTEQYRKARSRLIAEFGVPGEPFHELVSAANRMQHTGTRREGIAAGRFLGAFTKRRALLAATSAKRRSLARVVPSIADAERLLVFTQEIEAAENAAQVLVEGGVPAATFHSKLSTSVRQQLMARFAAGDLRVLVAVEVLDEGIDVPAADLAIILASTSQRRQMVQRMGRVLRRKPDGRPARFLLVYVEGTSEDPALGAHEAFFNEILDVAEEHQRFDQSASAEQIQRFLDPHR